MQPLLSRILALLEPLVLLVVSALWARYGLLALGIDPAAGDEALLRTPPGWGDAAAVEAARMAVRWAPLLLLVWWLARRRGYSLLRPFPRTFERWTAARAAALGLAMGLILAPLSSLTRAWHFLVSPLGETPPVWPILFGAEWTAEFWLFMAVGSFLVVPLVEELFFRGYLLGNLARLWRPRAAILLSAALFALVHQQYAAADAFALYNLTMVFAGGLATAWLVWRTGTLLPAVVEHAYANLPRPLDWAPFEAAGAVLGVVMLWALLRSQRGAGAEPAGAR